jgi:hypothetical protein
MTARLIAALLIVAGESAAIAGGAAGHPEMTAAQREASRGDALAPLRTRYAREASSYDQAVGTLKGAAKKAAASESNVASAVEDLLRGARTVASSAVAKLVALSSDRPRFKSAAVTTLNDAVTSLTDAATAVTNALAKRAHRPPPPRQSASLTSLTETASWFLELAVTVSASEIRGDTAKQQKEVDAVEHAVDQAAARLKACTDAADTRYKTCVGNSSDIFKQGECASAYAVDVAACLAQGQSKK